jgi:hypothetical protein
LATIKKRHLKEKEWGVTNCGVVIAWCDYTAWQTT